jgi:hypothetical protein
VEIFEIIQTAHTPYFKIDFDRGEIVYKGRFIPDIDPFDFMRPIYEALSEYAKSPLMLTNFDVYYEYVNTGNLHSFINLFKAIKKLEVQGVELFCRWHYEGNVDEDSLDLCEHVSDNSGLHFILVDDFKAGTDSF